MTITDAVREQITRLRVLWPTLNGRSEVTAEIERAVVRYEGKITPIDVEIGFDKVIELSPTTGWPPGPNEIVGCVLQAAASRKANAPRRRRDFGGGLTFSQWWHTLPHDERPQHEVLRRIMDPDGQLVAGSKNVDEIKW
jgi:hypothetical protein